MGCAEGCQRTHLAELEVLAFTSCGIQSSLLEPSSSSSVLSRRSRFVGLSDMLSRRCYQKLEVVSGDCVCFMFVVS